MFVPARRRRPATWTVHDYSSANEYYAHSIPASRWPSPHKSDAAFARIKLFVYPLPSNYTRAVFEAFGMHMKGSFANTSRECLVRPCHELGWDGKQAQMRTFSSEVPILMRMLQSCTLVQPSEAHAFLVPFPIGLWQIAGWIFRRSAKVSRLLDELPSHLTHLNERTISRHIFLNSVDSCYISVGTTVPLAHRAIVLHLGDDLWNSSSAKRLYHKTKLNQRGTRFNRSIVVPYRAPLPVWVESLVDATSRPLLLFGAIGVHRHPKRGLLVRTLTRAAERDPRAAGRVHLISNVSSVAEASEWARRSVFCLCPSGDAPAFTQRFYWSLLHGCIPVRVDLFQRAPPDVPAFPFSSLINWSRAVIDVGTADTLTSHGGSSSSSGTTTTTTRSTSTTATTTTSRRGTDHTTSIPQGWAAGLLPLLLDLEPTAMERRRYIHSIAHWLSFDAHGADGRLREQDAASATLYELAKLLGVTI